MSKYSQEQEKSLALIASAAQRPMSGFVTHSASGDTIYDAEGRGYLDFNQSVAVVGHANPRVVDSIEKHAKTLLVGGLTGWALLQPRLELAEALISRMPGQLKLTAKFAFCASGAEACDYGIKLARTYTKKSVIISFQGSYHGFTGLTSQVSSYDSELRLHGYPLVTDAVYSPFPYAYRQNTDEEKTSDYCLNSLKLILDTVVHPDDVAAVIIEPIQMHGGVVVAPSRFLQGLRKEICDRYDILLIDDEVFTCYGKSGRFLAIEHSGIEPDIICLGKAVGGCLPLGAIISRADIIDGRLQGNCRSSSGGNALACVTSLETLRILDDERLPQRAERLGTMLLDGFRELSKKHELIGDVRGKGLLIGVELVKDRVTKTPARDEAKRAIDEMRNSRILLTSTGIYDNVLRFVPPLIIQENSIQTVIHGMDKALQSLPSC